MFTSLWVPYIAMDTEKLKHPKHWKLVDQIQSIEQYGQTTALYQSNATKLSSRRFVDFYAFLLMRLFDKEQIHSRSCSCSGISKTKNSCWNGAMPMCLSKLQLRNPDFNSKSSWNDGLDNFRSTLLLWVIFSNNQQRIEFVQVF